MVEEVKPPQSYTAMLQIAGWRQELQRQAAEKDDRPIAPANLTPRQITREQLREPPPPHEYAISPLLPAKCLAEMSGAHGISKSTLAGQMVVSVVAGYEFAGLPTKQGRAVFISREDGFDDILRRLQAQLDNLDQRDRDRIELAICEQLQIFGREQTAGLKLSERMYGQCSLRRDSIELIVAAGQGAVLLVMETASRLSGGDEQNEDLQVLAEALEEIAERTGAAVLLVRHVSKQAARGMVADSYAGRGGGALSDAARSVLSLIQLDAELAAQHGIQIREGERIVMLQHAKASYSEPAEPVFFRRLPGPVLEQVESVSRAELYERWLLRYLSDHCPDAGPVSRRQIEKDRKDHQVPDRAVQKTLERLAAKGLIQSVNSIGRGGRRLLWQPKVPQVPHDHD